MVKVIVYSSPQCNDCKALKDFLSARGIVFIDKNVADDKSAREELAGKYGRMATPTLVIGDKMFLGFRENREAIERLLDGYTGGTNV
jgi:glutaredoxin 3